MAKTKIDWADVVWNPTVGCTKVSQGCKNCYAERMFERFHPGEKFSQVRCYPERLDQPLHWKKPRRVFVDSMSDLFHEDVPNTFISRVFWIMEMSPKHTFIVLTKRSKRMMEFVNQYYQGLLSNIWLLTSVEDQPTADERIPWLLRTQAAVRGVSVEPMLSEINISNYLPIMTIGGVELENWINWVIVGCESGPGARPMDIDWAWSLKNQCVAAGVPFFFKQAKYFGKLVKMPEMDGRVWDEYPGKAE